jgi:hypothetical protein
LYRAETLLENQTIGHQFPQIFNLEIRHPVFFFYVVKLTVTAMTGDNQHFGAAGSDLIHLFSGVKNAFFVVACYQRATAAAATNLIHTGWIKINPVFHALLQNPARFFKKSTSEASLSFAAVIAGVMIGCRSLKSGSVYFNAAFLYVLHQQIEDRYKSKFFKRLRIMFFETRPGRQIGMASFGP